MIGLASVTVVAAGGGPVTATALSELQPLASTATATSASSVTLRPDPSYQGRPFEGWGTSLAWFAEATGGYPDAIRTKLADLVFGPDGLNLNIARYNIGGGNAPDVPSYLRPGGAVEGWWKAPAGTTRASKDWWDPANPDHWNLGADATQRWWVDAIKSRITRWEAFSNSPPYFQTVSGYVSGGFSSTADQIRADKVDQFATYLVKVTQYLEKTHGIRFDSIEPLNEPNTNYWGTTLGASGNPTGGRQEGAHVSPVLQQAVVKAVAAQLQTAGATTRVASMDETNPGTFLTDWNAYADDARAAVSRLNVHTYGTGQRTAVRDVAKGEDKPLWMSEVEGSWGTGQSFTDMAPGLGIAQHMIDDLRELEPTAWTFWQPVEDYDNMKPGGENGVGGNWGSIQVSFACTAKDTLATCPVYTNTKFNTIRNFTHYIRPGDRLLSTGDTSSLAAISPANRLTVVYTNDSSAARTVALDLSGFAQVPDGTTVTPVVSSAAGGLVQGTPVRVTDRAASLQVPAQSVTTFVVNRPVLGIGPGAAGVQAGHVYRLQGAPSGRSLTPTSDGSGLVLRTNDAASVAQLWTLQPLGSPVDSRGRYAVRTAAGSRILATSAGGGLTTVAVSDPAAAPEAAGQWILSTTGDGRYTLVNVGTRRVIDVGGAATADGSSVGVWLANSNSNQLWRIVDETVLGVQPVQVFTLPGTAPVMPATVVPVYRDGARGTLPVTWTMPSASVWAKRGSVPVHGVAKDVAGRTHDVQATVIVDTLVSTLPARAKTYVGGTPSLPAAVDAVSTLGFTVVGRPVTWAAVTPAQVARQGVVTVTGTADAGGGVTLPARLRLQVTQPGEENAALAAGTTATATFTEPGYSAAGVINGNLTDKAWSNWQSGKSNASDTLTVTLPQSRNLTHVVTQFYRDGRDSYAQTLHLQVQSSGGSWADAGGPVSVPTGSPAPAVDVAVPASVGASSAVRVVLDAYSGSYLTVSEIQVFAKVPGRSSDSTASTIALGGVPLAGFAPGTTSYTVKAGRSLPVLTAVAADPYASVRVTQPWGRTLTGTVTVTSEDSTATTTYTIRFV